jgi:hypothetical protein
VTREEFAELLYRYGEACEQAQLTGADHKQAEGRVLAAFDALQAEATISYEALERQREATKAAEREVEALRTERDGLKVILFDARQSVLTEGQRANAAEAEVEALRAEVERQRNLWSAIRDSRTDAAEARALAAESSLAEAMGALNEIAAYAEDPDEDLGTAEWCMKVDDARMRTLAAARALLSRLAAKED